MKWIMFFTLACQGDKSIVDEPIDTADSIDSGEVDDSGDTIDTDGTGEPEIHHVTTAVRPCAQ